VSTGSESPPEHRLSLSEKLARRRERHIQHSMPYRVAFVIVAFAILIGGLALIPLPGPGWAIVFIGLGMLALEFKWAEHLMEKILDRLEAAKQSAANASPMQKAFGVAATVLGIAAFVVAAILWDIPLLPVV
jgi:uncharacterized protein (TIGR02611 family)